jgi:ketosteroid isomerase-like protein
MRRTRLLSAVVPAVLLAACSPGRSTPAADTTAASAAGVAAPASADKDSVRREIEAANTRFIDAMNRGDTVGMYADYAGDAVLMMTGSPALRGRVAITQTLNQMMTQVTLKDPKFHIDDVLLGGDLAVETGSYEWTVVPKQGKPAPDKGKYVVVWQRQADGSLKIIRDISNSDGAPAR